MENAIVWIILGITSLLIIGRFYRTIKGKNRCTGCRDCAASCSEYNEGVQKGD